MNEMSPADRKGRTCQQGNDFHMKSTWGQSKRDVYLQTSYGAFAWVLVPEISTFSIYASSLMLSASEKSLWDSVTTQFMLLRTSIISEASIIAF